MAKRQYLVTARRQLGLNQAKVADLLGIAQSTYAGYESGRRNPKVGTAMKIARLLGIGFEKIYTQDNEEEKPCT